MAAKDVPLDSDVQVHRMQSLKIPSIHYETSRMVVCHSMTGFIVRNSGCLDGMMVFPHLSV